MGHRAEGEFRFPACNLPPQREQAGGRSGLGLAGLVSLRGELPRWYY